MRFHETKAGSQRLKSIAFLALISGLIVLAFGSWALASPLGSSPDDDFHLTSIWCSGDGYPGLCEPSALSGHRQVAGILFKSQDCYAKNGNASAGCQAQSGVLQDFVLFDHNHGNYSGGYPPVFYATMHLFATENVVRSAIVMRFVNIAIFLVLFLLTWISTARWRSRSAVSFIWIGALVPLGMFLIPSNNPSSWAIMGIGFMTLSVIAYFSSDSNTKSKFGLALIFILATIMASGARGDSAAYAVLAIVCSLIFSIKSVIQNKRLLILPGIALAIIGLFFVASRHATVVTSGFGDQAQGVTYNPGTLLIENILRFPTLLIGAFTGWKWGLGWFDTQMPEFVSVTSAAAFFSIVIISWQKLDRAQAVALSIASLAVAAIPLYVMEISNIQVGQLIQPRYIYPLLILVGVLALSTKPSEQYFGSRYWRTFMFIGISGANAAALFITISRFTRGQSAPVNLNLDSSYEWWWPSLGVGPEIIMICGGIAFMTLALIALKPWRYNTENHEAETVLVNKR